VLVEFFLEGVPDVIAAIEELELQMLLAVVCIKVLLVLVLDIYKALGDLDVVVFFELMVVVL